MEYEVLRRLSDGHVPGDVVSEDDFRPGVVEVLVERRAIRAMSADLSTDLSTDGTDLSTDGTDLTDQEQEQEEENDGADDGCTA